MAVTFNYLHNYERYGKCILVLKCVLQISVLKPFKNNFVSSIFVAIFMSVHALGYGLLTCGVHPTCKASILYWYISLIRKIKG